MKFLGKVDNFFAKSWKYELFFPTMWYTIVQEWFILYNENTNETHELVVYKEVPTYTLEKFKAYNIIF